MYLNVAMDFLRHKGRADSAKVIGDAAKAFFVLSLRHIWDIGKGADSGHVGEIGIVDATDIEPARISFFDYAQRAPEGSVDAEVLADVADRATVDVADRRRVLLSHESPDDVIERAIAT